MEAQASVPSSLAAGLSTCPSLPVVFAAGPSELAVADYGLSQQAAAGQDGSGQ